MLGDPKPRLEDPKLRLGDPKPRVQKVAILHKIGLLQTWMYKDRNGTRFTQIVWYRTAMQETECQACRDRTWRDGMDRTCRMERNRIE